MIRAALKWVGTFILFAAIAFCFAPTLVPPFLDRVYYRGPAGTHFDGEHFFNPDFPSPGQADPRRILNRWISSERAVWPESVPVRPTVPPRRVPGGDMLVAWIGHSTVLVQTQGLNILTDPIWSERASPFSFVGPRRVRAPGVRFENLPGIDLVLVSHNHYDHMDLPTLRRLWDRDRPLIVTSLGNDTLLRGAGIESAARHGPFRLAILPVGAYLPRDIMQDSHIGPAEALRIFETLRPVRALAVHWGTFQLAFDAIDDPPRTLAALKRQRGIAPGRFAVTEVGQTFRVPAR